MIKILLTSAGAIALASTAAFADPAETAAQPDQMPQYKAQSAAEETAIAPIEVTTREDAKKLADMQFALADINADGVIDQPEFAAFAAAAARADAGLPAGAEVAASAAPPEKAFSTIAKIDGKISKQELTEARVKSFDAADKNRDKQLDALEQQKFAALVAVKAPSPEQPQ